MYTKTNIYVLELEAGRWYVGMSVDVDRRYQQHVSGVEGGGARWTSKFRPIGLAKQFQVLPAHGFWHEQQETYRLMLRYGINNVRGGPLSSTWRNMKMNV